ncbi:MAG: hypothetical protein ABJO72_01010 [Hyphomicrobiales bacterium]
MANDNHCFIKKILRKCSRDYPNCGYPEYEFRKLADHLKCDFEDVFEAFCPPLEKDKTKAPIGELEGYERRLRKETGFSRWRVQYGMVDIPRVRKRKRTKESAQTIHKSIKQIIPEIEKMYLYGDEEWKGLRNRKFPSVSQLKNLRDHVKQIIDLPEPPNFGAAKPHAALVAEYLVDLFIRLGIDVKLGSKSEATSKYSKALVKAFEIFCIDARFDTIAAKVIDEKIR